MDCTKRKPKHPGYGPCHLSSFGAKVYTVEIGSWSGNNELSPTHQSDPIAAVNPDISPPLIATNN